MTISTPPPSSPEDDDRPVRWFRRVFIGIAGLVVMSLVSAWQYYHSPYRNGVGIAVTQPIQFSHRHHAGELKLDCRYCHTSVENDAFAGVPDAHTCLTCHSQIFTDTAMLQPLVQSASQHTPLRWNRVNNVPDFVFFNHSAHISHGIDCAACHGDVADMPLVAKAESLDMRWCLECHRDVQTAGGVHDPRRTHLTDCSTCHH